MTNKEAFELAKKYIPGGVDSPVRERRRRAFRSRARRGRVSG